MFYSKSSGGFYSPDIHDEMPADVVTISDEEWTALLDGQTTGKVITADADGYPKLADPPPPPPEAVLTPVQKLERLGLTVDELKAALGL